MSVECPICCEPFTYQRKPKALPCGHSVCSSCVTQLRNSGSDFCPQCKSPVRSWELPDNYSMIDMFDSIRIPSDDVAAYFSSLHQKDLQNQRQLEECAKKEAELVAQRASRLQEIQRANEPERLKRQFNFFVEEFLVSAKQQQVEIHEEARGTSYVKICQEKCAMYYRSLQIIGEEFISQPQLPRQFPDELDLSPVHLSINILQDQINIKDRYLISYAEVLKNIDTTLLQLAQSKEDLMRFYQDEHNQMETERKKHTAGMQEAAEKSAEAKTYIEKLKTDKTALAEKRRIVAVELQEQMLKLEIEGRNQIQQLITEMNTIGARSSQANEQRKLRFAATIKLLQEYLKFLKKFTLEEQKKNENIGKRIEATQKTINFAIKIGEIEEFIAILQQTKLIPERERDKLTQELTDLKQEIEAQRKEIAVARSQIGLLEGKIKLETEKSEKLRGNIEILARKNKKLEEGCELFDRKITELAGKMQVLKQKKGELTAETHRVSSILDKAEHYVSDILLPFHGKVGTHRSQQDTHFKQQESQCMAQLQDLEYKQSRLTIRQFSSMQTRTSTPPRSPVRAASPVPVLTAANLQLTDDCAKLKEKIRSREMAITRRKVYDQPSSPETNMTWAMLASLAVMYLVLTWSNSAM